MPGYDGTGPMGQGPRTGGGMGYCPPGAPRYVNPPRVTGMGRGRGGYGRGMGRGFGRGFRRGMGRGFGWGRGPQQFTAWPEAAPVEIAYEREMTSQEEISVLKDQAGLLQEELKSINKRLEELQGKEKTPGNAE